MPLPTAPTLLLAVGGLHLILARWVRSSRWFEAVWLAVVVCVGAWLILGDGQSAAPDPEPRRWLNDPLAIAGQWLALMTGLVFGAGSFGFRSANDRTASRFGFLSCLIAGGMLTAAANDLITVALSVELVQFAAWSLRKVDGLEQVHVSPEREDDTFRWLGIAASICLWLGIGFIVNVAGSTEYDQIRRVLVDAYAPGAGRMAIGGGSRWGLLAMGLVLAGLGSRIGLVPWQLGLVEASRGVGYWTAGCILVVNQLCGVLALARLCGAVWIGYREELLLMLGVLTGVTLAVAGGLAALGLTAGEGRLKRWTIALTQLHGAWLMIGLMAAVADVATPHQGLSSSAGQPGSFALLLFACGASQLGLSGLFLMLSYSTRNDREIEYVDELLGQFRLQPFPAVVLVLLLASLVGQPPLWGFWSNWLLMIAGLNVRAAVGREMALPHAGMMAVVVMAVAATLMAAGIAVRCARVILLEEPVARTLARGRRSSLVMACVCASLLIAVGLFPRPLLRLFSTVRSPSIESRPEEPAGSSRGNSTAQWEQGQPDWFTGGPVTRRAPFSNAPVR